MDGGSIELLSNQGEVLAVLKLCDPAAQDASAAGQKAFAEITKSAEARRAALEG